MTTHSDKNLGSAGTHHDNAKGADQAADLIRQKIDSLYDSEPSAVKEAEEVLGHSGRLSKHQLYMKGLTESGRSLADIQTAWHEYYAALPDSEKHAVWQEFYAEHQHQTQPSTKESKGEPTAQTAGAEHNEIVKKANARNHRPESHSKKTIKQRPEKLRSVAEIKRQLVGKATNHAEARLNAKQHFQSMLFGVGVGSVVLLFLLFGFFNERFIAPFITPSRQVTNTPIIIDGSATAASNEPKIVIPKINVEIPVVYDQPSIEEKAVQNALEKGVVHYATTPHPGEKGNAVIFGHSSNNILNKGQYKFAFVLLNRLDSGDIFYVTKNGTRYAYRIYDKKIVKPTELSVLNSLDKPATMSLITCDPPGTTINRLVVVGEQITPDPGKNSASTARTTDTPPETLPSNAPSLWQRLTGWIGG